MSTGKTLVLSPAQLEVVSRLFGALAEPNRLALLQALQAGPKTVGELMTTCGMKQANVSKHLGILHDHRLVRRQPEGTQVYYEIADPIVFALCKLVCGKMQRDAERVLALFHPEI